MLDSRFIQTSKLYEIAKNSYTSELTKLPNEQPSKYFTLKQFESYLGTYDGLFTPHTDTFTIPINIPTDAKIYHSRILIYIDPTIAVNFDFRLNPNNVFYNTTDYYIAISNNVNYGAYTHIGTECFAWTDCQAGWADTSPLQVDMYCVPQPLTHKHVIFRIGDLNGITTSYARWNDTTTPWTKFGSFGLSGLAISGTTTFLTTPTNIKIKCYVQRLV